MLFKTYSQWLYFVLWNTTVDVFFFFEEYFFYVNLRFQRHLNCIFKINSRPMIKVSNGKIKLYPIKNNISTCLIEWVVLNAAEFVVTFSTTDGRVENTYLFLFQWPHGWNSNIQTMTMAISGYYYLLYFKLK